MFVFSFRNILNRSVGEKTIAILTIPVFVVFGSTLSLLGAFVGMAIGVTIGGNFFVPFEYGGLPGYEGAGLFGNMVGAAAVSFGLIALWVRDGSMRRRSLITYVGLWSIAAVVQHLIALKTHEWSPLCIVAPIVISGVVTSVFFRRAK